MLVIGHPQFDTQDDVGTGHGIPPIGEWQLDPTVLDDDLSDVSNHDIDHAVRNVFIRLRSVFQRAQRVPLPTTRLHDLTCFVVHRLLLSAPDTANAAESSPITECIRYAIIIYMFITQGPTYYSHAVILNTMVTRFAGHMKNLESIPREYGSLDVWLLAVGMVATTGTHHYQWLMGKAQDAAASLELGSWIDILGRIKSILWLETRHRDDVFRPHWDAILGTNNQPKPPGFATSVSPRSVRAGYI